MIDWMRGLKGRILHPSEFPFSKLVFSLSSQSSLGHFRVVFHSRCLLLCYKLSQKRAVKLFNVRQVLQSASAKDSRKYSFSNDFVYASVTTYSIMHFADTSLSLAINHFKMFMYKIEL